MGSRAGKGQSKWNLKDKLREGGHSQESAHLCPQSGEKLEEEQGRGIQGALAQSSMGMACAGEGRCRTRLEGRSMVTTIWRLRGSALCSTCGCS